MNLKKLSHILQPKRKFNSKQERQTAFLLWMFLLFPLLHLFICYSLYLNFSLSGKAHTLLYLYVVLMPVLLFLTAYQFLKIINAHKVTDEEQLISASGNQNEIPERNETPQIARVYQKLNSKMYVVETAFANSTQINELLERYDFISKATSDTIWDWDISRDTIVYNGGIHKMFGYTSIEVQEIRTWWINNIHEQDIDHVNHMLQVAFKRQSQNVELMYRYKCADGSYKYIFDRAFILYDKNGVPVRMIGSMQDETIRYEEENRITKAIIQAQESERQQLGMELHDNVNQLLSAAILQLGFLASKKSINEPALQTVCDVKEYIKEAIEEIRRLSHRLAPASDADVSICELIRTLANSFNIGGQYKVSCRFDFPDPECISKEMRVGLYRILQEQLSNIVKHAKASTITIEVVRNKNSVELVITDDGIGFDITVNSSGIGFENIKRRVKFLNGTVQIESEPHKGCCLKVNVPVAARN